MIVRQLAKSIKKIKYLTEILIIAMNTKSNLSFCEKLKFAKDIQDGLVFKSEHEEIPPLPPGSKVLPFNSD